MITIEEQEKAMKQLVNHVNAVCKEYNISVVLNVCIETEIKKGAIIQMSSQTVCGTEITLKRMLAGAIKHLNGFKTLLIDAFNLSERMSMEDSIFKTENLN